MRRKGNKTEAMGSRKIYKEIAASWLGTEGEEKVGAEGDS